MPHAGREDGFVLLLAKLQRFQIIVYYCLWVKLTAVYRHDATRFLQELYLGSVLMMDPMSLLDYPEVDGSEDVLISVIGEMSEESKK